MLIDMAVSNYFLAIYAARLEMEFILSATDYTMEISKLNVKGVRPYISACRTSS
jgi:hypothetical protein